MTIKIQGDKITFPDNTEQTTAYDGSSGGGSTPTPEDLVWENKIDERVLNTEYTNTNNVPIYVQLYFSASSVDTHLRFLIDGKTQGVVGNGARADQVSYQNPFYIVPSGSTYKVQQTGTVSLLNWDEARMPLAIAVGGASGGGDAQPPVAFKMGTSGAVTQPLVSGAPTKIVCPSVTLDTDNLINDSTITIKKEGIYQFNATFTSATGDPSSVVAFININGTNLAGGSHNPAGTPQFTSTVSNIFELKVGDKVEFWGQVSGTDLTAYKEDRFASLSGHMISSITEGEVKEKEAVVVTAKLDAPLPIVTNTWVALPFNTTHDTNGSYDVVNKQFKPSVAGFYQINYQARFDPAGGTVVKGNRQGLELRDKDDTRVAYLSQDFDDVNNSNTSTLSTIVYFDGVSDYITPQAWASYPVITIADEDQTLFSAHLITGQSSGGSGGGEVQEAVVMKAGLSSAVPTLSNNSIPVPYDTVEFGNSSDMVDGKFKPSVKGYYNIMASANCTTTSQPRAFLSMFKNGGADAIYKTMDVDGTRIRNTNVSGIVYFNGTTDYVDFTYWTTTASTLDIKNTIFNAHLITGQSTGGGSGGGTTDILPVLYSGSVSASGGVNYGTGFTANKDSLGTYTITFNTTLDTDEYVADVSIRSSGDRTVTLIDQTETSFTVITKNENGTLTDCNFGFTVTGTETIAVGGGSGGSYTPEKMVWEDKLSERAWDTEYTNTQDVPLYVQVSGLFNPSNTFNKFYIDGVAVGIIGEGSGEARSQYHSSLFIVPSGSTYQLTINDTRSSRLDYWLEARMPVAVGTGGKTVAFKGGISARQEGLTSNVFTKVNLDTTSIDTDNALTDGKFKPSVAGYYQVNGSFQAWQTPETTNVITKIRKNGLDYCQGTQVSANNTFSSQVSDVVYLNGTTDYLELMAYLTVATGTGSVDERITHTYLSAVLVSGGSASGSGGSAKTATWTAFAGSATPTILNESNIASIDRISKGLYHLTFKEPMSSDDYAVQCSMGSSSGTATNVSIIGYAIDKTKCYVAMRTIGETPVAYESDGARISVTATDSKTIAVGGLGDSSGGDSMPSGSIIMYGKPDIPDGWALCDGTNDTPDLRDKFVVGAGTSYELDATGGSADAVVVSHIHGATSSVSDPGHKHLNGTKRMHDAATGQYGDSANFGNVTRAVTRWEVPDSASFDIDYTQTKTTGIGVSTTVATNGVSGTNKNLPPYYALAYIMKL